MKDVENIGYIGWCQKKAHEEIEYIFQELMPKKGLNVREEQLRLSHEMLDTLWGKQIALCDAGVGIGKTYAYLVACIMLDKYGENGGCVSKPGCHPAVISLKWAVQRGQIPIPFSVHEMEYESNINSTCDGDLLTDEEMAKIATLEKNNRLVKGQVFLWEGAKDWHDLWDEEGVIVDCPDGK